MRKAIYLGLIVLLAAGAWLGVMQWRDFVARRHDEELYRSACELLKNGRAADASAAIHSRLPGARRSDEATRQWRELQVAVSVQLRQVGNSSPWTNAGRKSSRKTKTPA